MTYLFLRRGPAPGAAEVCVASSGLDAWQMVPIGSSLIGEKCFCKLRGPVSSQAAFTTNRSDLLITRSDTQPTSMPSVRPAPSAACRGLSLHGPSHARKRRLAKAADRRAVCNIDVCDENSPKTQGRCVWGRRPPGQVKAFSIYNVLPFLPIRAGAHAQGTFVRACEVTEIILCTSDLRVTASE